MENRSFIIQVIIIIAVIAGVTGGLYIRARQDRAHTKTHQKNGKHVQQIAQEQIGIKGETKSGGISPMRFLTTWNFNNLKDVERRQYYKETELKDGSALREYWVYAVNEDIELAPGVTFPAWTYNGQVPGPTIRATEGDTIKIHFRNAGNKPHTMHFHGFHSAKMDGAMTHDFVLPGKSFTYEFKAAPFGLHLYHCHSLPISQHFNKGLYGAYIVDPKESKRPKAAKEMIMVLNSFDTNFDGENEIYGVNTKAFYYDKNPIRVKKDELVRLYVVNVTEFDPVNSFHLHANFFDEYKTGTSIEPNQFTDIVSFIQGERSILDVRFREPGQYMFHAHQSEFTEKGWTGLFEVEE